MPNASFGPEAVRRDPQTHSELWDWQLQAHIAWIIGRYKNPDEIWHLKENGSRVLPRVLETTVLKILPENEIVFTYKLYTSYILKIIYIYIIYNI